MLSNLIYYVTMFGETPACCSRVVSHNQIILMTTLPCRKYVQEGCKIDNQLKPPGGDLGMPAVSAWSKRIRKNLHRAFTGQIFALRILAWTWTFVATNQVFPPLGHGNKNHQPDRLADFMAMFFTQS